MRVVLSIGGVFLLLGLYMLHPKQAALLLLFGAYHGTDRSEGLRWANPFYTKKRISVRVRNFESARLKVNDNEGNPIEIAAVVVWQVEDTARASFEVDDFIQFVATQTEAAVRHIAGKHPYDSYGDDAVPSLRDSAEAITEQLSKEVAERVDAAGVKIVESRFTHLAYAPEIAQAMLQRQQASAMIAARAEIVEGAVTLVDRALERLSDEDVVDLDEERKAAMVSNLLVVLCSDRPASPVVNTGTLYQ